MMIGLSGEYWTETSIGSMPRWEPPDPNATSKVCTKCERDLPFDCFYKMRRGRYGLNSWCKECMDHAKAVWKAEHADEVAQKNREWYEANPERVKENKRRSLLRAYGITPEDYERLRRKQKGRCAICRKRRKLVVDHCHKTNKVRGLLCSKCNLGIGHLGDTAASVRAAYLYLKRREQAQ